MRQHLRVLRLPSIFLSFVVVISAAMIAGCESGADPDSPEAKKVSQATRESIQKVDEKNTADLKKRNKNAPVLKSIKGGIKSEPAAP